jgi:hypothetical protein
MISALKECGSLFSQYNTRYKRVIRQRGKTVIQTVRDPETSDISLTLKIEGKDPTKKGNEKTSGVHSLSIVNDKRKLSLRGTQ